MDGQAIHHDTWAGICFYYVELEGIQTEIMLLDLKKKQTEKVRMLTHFSKPILTRAGERRYNILKHH